MTLEEYEKIKEEKRKALLVMKAQERKVEFDKDFQSMKQLSIKKDNDDIFIKLVKLPCPTWFFICSNNAEVFSNRMMIFDRVLTRMLVRKEITIGMKGLKR